MRKAALLQALGVALIASLPATPAKADIYGWTISGGGYVGSGLLSTGTQYGSFYDVAALGGTLNGQPVRITGTHDGATHSYFPAGSSFGIFYDNLISLTAPASFDGAGLFLTGPGGGTLNVFDDPSTVIYDLGSLSTNGVTFTLSTSPVVLPTLWDWTVSGGGYSGSGTLTLGAQYGGYWDVSTFDGTLNGAPVSIAGEHNGGTNSFFIGSNGIFYNNLIDPLSYATFDGAGLFFTGLGGAPLNIFGSPSTTLYDLNELSLNDIEFSLTPAPEPTSLALLGTAVIGLGTGRRRRR